MNRKLIITISLLIALATVLAIVPVQAAADISAIFDADYYINKYWDLKGMDAETAKVHFMNWGIKEGRCASASFDVKYYVANNWDLAGMDYVTAASHYLQWGINENRKTIEDNGFAEFDAKHYKANYWDLANMSDSAAYDHYIKYGKAEGRVIPEHVFKGEVAEDKIVLKPTCVKEGLGLANCTVCGTEFRVTMPKVGHDFETTAIKTEPAKKPCVDHGRELVSCQNCEYAEWRDLDLAEHKFTEVIYSTEPTCPDAKVEPGKEGKKIVRCEICQKVETQILVSEHTSKTTIGAGEIIKPATCTTTGLEKVICKDCGKSFERELPVVAHDFKLVDTADCHKAGVKQMECSICGAIDTKTKPVTSPKKQHVWESYKVEPATCTVDGYKKQVCSICGDIRTEVIKAGHNWVEDNTTANYSKVCAKGLEVTYKCADLKEEIDEEKVTTHIGCNATSKATLTGHNYTKADGTPNYKTTTKTVDGKTVTVEMKPDCKTGTPGTLVCSRCAANSIAATSENGVEKTVAAEHTYLKDSKGNIEYQVKASCENNAKAICTICATEVEVPYTMHTPVFTAPTCTTDGKLVCSNPNCTIKNKDLSELPGYIAEFCKKADGTSYTTLKTPGHDFTNSTPYEKDGKTYEHCEVCDQEVLRMGLVSARKAGSSKTMGDRTAIYEENMANVQPIVVNNNVINVTLNSNKLKEYTDEAGKRYFGILVNMGTPRTGLSTVKEEGSDYTVETVDVEQSNEFGANDNEVILWLSIEKFKPVLNTETGKYSYTDVPVVLKATETKTIAGEVVTKTFTAEYKIHLNDTYVKTAENVNG